jgi:transposase-like protein
MITNFDKLRLLGEALHGPRWQNAVARDLGVNPRQVHRWVSGQYEPHESHIADLIALAKDRKLQITEAIECSTAM